MYVNIDDKTYAHSNILLKIRKSQTLFSAKTKNFFDKKMFFFAYTIT